MKHPSKQHYRKSLFPDALRDFKQRKTDEGKSTSHIQSTYAGVKEFLSYLKNHQVYKYNQINQTIIDQYLNYLWTRPNRRSVGTLQPSYIAKHREAILRFIEYLQRVDLGESSFFIPSPKLNKQLKDILTLDEVKSLFQACDFTLKGRRTKAILSLLYGCGIRNNELHNLNKQDIYYNEGYIYIKQSKTASQRKVPLTSKIKQCLQDYAFGVRNVFLPEGVEESAFLLNNLGSRMSRQSINVQLRAIKAKTKITKPLSAHRLRHAFATHLLGSCTLEEIARILGHSSLDSTQIYTHIQPNE